MMKNHLIGLPLSFRRSPAPRASRKRAPCFIVDISAFRSVFRKPDRDESFALALHPARKFAAVTAGIKAATPPRVSVCVRDDVIFGPLCAVERRCRDLLFDRTRANFAPRFAVGWDDVPQALLALSRHERFIFGHVRERSRFHAFLTHASRSTYSVTVIGSQIIRLSRARVIIT